MKPFRESATDRYCRLFPPCSLPTDVDLYCRNLTALGRAMIDDGSRVSNNRPEILADCGYTYFGQFIAHDLTKDASSIDEAWKKEPEQLQNLRTPRLDLDSLYGRGPAVSPDLYENDQVRLRVGSAQSSDKGLDICTGAQGERILGDERNAENLILRQMTLSSRSCTTSRWTNLKAKQPTPRNCSSALDGKRNANFNGWSVTIIYQRC